VDVEWPGSFDSHGLVDELQMAECGSRMGKLAKIAFPRWLMTPGALQPVKIDGEHNGDSPVPIMVKHL
jgi:hypothetical protein